MSEVSLDCVLFGAIGTLAHCSELQWKFYNETLHEFFEEGKFKLAAGSGDSTTAAPHKQTLVDSNGKEFTAIWDRDAYEASLVATGGRIRVAQYLRDEYGVVEESEESMKRKADAIHSRKTELFIHHIETIGLTLRPGILDLLKACKAAGVKTGFCSVTDKRVVDAFVKRLELGEYFDIASSEEDLMKFFPGKPKPAPHCYWWVTKKLVSLSSSTTQEDPRIVSAADEEECAAMMKTLNVIAFEDTQISLESPVSAHVSCCVAVPSEWAVKQDFGKAAACFKEITDVRGSSQRNADKIQKTLGDEAGDEGGQKTLAKLVQMCAEQKRSC